MRSNRDGAESRSKCSATSRLARGRDHGIMTILVGSKKAWCFSCLVNRRRADDWGLWTDGIGERVGRMGRHRGVLRRTDGRGV